VSSEYLDRFTEGAEGLLADTEASRRIGVSRFCCDPRENHSRRVRKRERLPVVDDAELTMGVESTQDEANLASILVVSVLKNRQEAIEGIGAQRLSAALRSGAAGSKDCALPA
jgi:hypothetical protein